MNASNEPNQPHFNARSQVTKLRVLVVEDDEECYELLADQFDALNFPNEISRVCSGRELFAHLNELQDQDMPLPHVILLDLYLPEVNGIEILREIKLTEAFRDIPVALLTSSNEREHMRNAYKLGALTYLQKPFELKELQTFIEQIQVLGIMNPRRKPS